jgi:hypothetical protein
VANPALKAFVGQLRDELVFGQIVIRRSARGYELRHEADRQRAASELRHTPVAEARVLAQHTAVGAFRPLKSAPNLPSGWRVIAQDDGELEAVLQQLYPGGVADWFAAQQQPARVTPYREFTVRQTGMYRVTAMLTDEQAAQVTRACCHRRFCLKRRLWTVGSQGPDEAGEKSLIPCLEPCAILLEFARKAYRIEQENEGTAAAAPRDMAGLEAGIEAALRAANPAEREADFDSPGNPRRLQLEVEKRRAAGTANSGPDAT